jgi:hypothetical protein
MSTRAMMTITVWRQGEPIGERTMTVGLDREDDLPAAAGEEAERIVARLLKGDQRDVLADPTPDE